MQWSCRGLLHDFLWTDFEGLELQTVAFTLKQIRAATNNFDVANKIGEGGFGSVFKVLSLWKLCLPDVPIFVIFFLFLIEILVQGSLPDGTVIAVKQLSSRSRQGNREFLNEIGMISCLQHPNLVKLYGCCIEGDQLLVVYEYMENNSLAHVLFGKYFVHSLISQHIHSTSVGDKITELVSSLQSRME